MDCKSTPAAEARLAYPTIEEDSNIDQSIRLCSATDRRKRKHRPHAAIQARASYRHSADTRLQSDSDNQTDSCMDRGETPRPELPPPVCKLHDVRRSRLALEAR